MIRAAFAAIALTASTGAAAHNFWLQPESHTPDAGEEVRIDFKIGDAGEEADDWGLYWERVASFRLYGPDGASDQQSSVRTTGDGEVGGAVVSVTEPGTYVLSFESNPSFSDLSGDRFDRYVANEGLGAIAAHREATGTTGENGTELYARRAKALLQVGETTTDNVTQPVGQLLEIVPLANPFAMRDGDTLRVQILWRGQPLEGATLHVLRPFGDGEDEQFVTGQDGVASVTMEWGSRYLLTSVWGVPAPNDSRADYFTIFSSLTFASPLPAPETQEAPPEMSEAP